MTTVDKRLEELNDAVLHHSAMVREDDKHQTPNSREDREKAWKRYEVARRRFEEAVRLDTLDGVLDLEAQRGDEA